MYLAFLKRSERIQKGKKKVARCKKSPLRSDAVVTWLDFSMIPKVTVQY